MYVKLKGIKRYCLRGIKSIRKQSQEFGQYCKQARQAEKAVHGVE
jgi:hypothetical protein